MAPSTNSDHLWFLASRVIVRIAHRDGTDGISLFEQWAPCGESAPLHFHRTEDEAFHVLEGELRIRIDGHERRVGPGQALLVPKGVAHTYRVESAEGAHWLVITTGGDFELFVRSMARPAEQATLPPPAGELTPAAMHRLSETARAHGIEIIGPPMQPD